MPRALLLALLLAGCLAAPATQAKTLTVGPGQKFKTITAALSQATPGTTITVLPGTYQETIRTVRHGSARSPIRLQAQGHVKIVGPPDTGHLVELQHDHYQLRGFELTRADILLWLQNADHNDISHNFFHHSEGECLRLRYHSRYNLIHHNRLEDCGDSRNGEGIYLGTAPEQLDRNPTSETDRTSYNTVHTNTFNTRGNECVDIKEGAEHNLIEHNDCTGQRDPESGGFSSRGNYNIFRYNKSYGNKGAGIRLGGDTKRDGLYNEVYGNDLRQNLGYALKIMRAPSGRICDNRATQNQRGFSNQKTLANKKC